MKNKEGEIEENKDLIREMFEEFYTDLFKKKNRDIDAEMIVNKELEQIVQMGKQQQSITFNSEESKIQKIKRKQIKIVGKMK